MQRVAIGIVGGGSMALVIAAGILFSAVAVVPAKAWNSTDISNALPPLDFTMTRASDGTTVTGANYKGKIILLDFGYTSCPDVCPTTLLNLSTMLKELGQGANDVRVLFVTVDPNRDTLSIMKEYAGSFAPQVVGLRGTSSQLAALAKRYRVAYSVAPSSDGQSYEVSHGTAVYVFDRSGDAKLLFSGVATPNGSLAGMTDDLKELLSGTDLLAGGAASWECCLGASARPNDQLGVVARVPLLKVRSSSLRSAFSTIRMATSTTLADF